MNMVLYCKDCGWRTEPNEFTSYCPECRRRGDRKTLSFIKFSDAELEVANRLLKAHGIRPLPNPTNATGAAVKE